MGNVVLMLKSLGINDLLNFDFMDKPPPETLMKALEQLYALGALNDRGELTKLGRRMAEFPVDPMMSKVIIASEKYNCSNDILTIIAMLSIGSSVFYRPKDRAVHADNARLNFARGNVGDHISLMRVYNEWVETDYSTQWCYENYIQIRNLNKARDIREQLEGLCERVEVNLTSTSSIATTTAASTVGSNNNNIDAISKALVSGFFYNIAKFSKNSEYKTIKNPHTVYIHPSSVLMKQEAPSLWVMYYELAFTTKEYMRTVMPIQGEWLLEVAPHYYKQNDINEDDNSKKKLSKHIGKLQNE
jgi:pre-mRNA-splicing factor ATP-dependent RNA helicase DHX16